MFDRPKEKEISLDALDVLSLAILVLGWRREIVFLVGHETSLLLSNSSLVTRRFVMSQTQTAAVVRREERLSTDKLAPQAHQNSADHHSNHADTDTSDNTNQDRQNNVGGEFAEQQRPAVLTVGHVSRVVTVVVVSVGTVSVVRATHHVGATMKLHALELLGKNGTPLAEDSRALVGVILRRGR